MSSTQLIVVLALLAAAAASDIYCPPECALKRAGVTSNKEDILYDDMSDGQCNAKIDLSYVLGCKVKGVEVCLCDLDASKPLLSISNDLSFINVERTGHCRGHIFSTVKVWCEEPARRRMAQSRASARSASAQF